MVNRPKQRGTQAEGWVRDYAQQTYWPNARRLALAGNKDIGDLDLHPRIMVEVKVADAGLDMGGWMRETDQQMYRKEAHYGVLVMKPKGYGEKKVSQFLAAMRSGLMYKLLWDTGAIRMTEHPLFQAHRIDPLVRLHELEKSQNETGNMFNVVTYRVRMEEDPNLFYSFMRLGPLFDLLNLAGYGKYLDVSPQPWRPNESELPPNRM